MNNHMFRTIMVLLMGVALVLVSGCTDTLYTEDTSDERMMDG
jgi:hypothetical protein